MKAIIALFALFSPLLYAQEFLITAERIPLPIENTTSSVSTFEANSDSLKEGLETNSGVIFTQAGELGGTTSFSIRGLGRGQTRIRFDGLDLEDASDIDNDFQFQQLSMGMIGKVELTRGVQSGLYGADAVGGVFLLSPDDENSNLEFKVGAYDQKGVSGKLKNEKGTTLLLDYFSSEGISAYKDGAEKDSFRRLNAYVKQNWKVNAKWEIDFKGLFLMSDAEIDGGFPFGDLEQNDQSQFTQGVYALSARYLPSGNQRHQLQFNISHNDVIRTVQGLRYEGKTQRAEVDYTFLASTEYAVRVNLEGKKQEAIVENAFDKKTEDIVGASLTGHFQKKRFFGHQSFRFDYHSQFDGIWSSQTGLGVKLVRHLNLKGNYSTGFKAPTLYQLHAPFSGISNPNLKAQRARGGDIGLVYNDGTFSVESTYFRTDLSRQIDFDNGYYNIAKSRFSGLEQSVSYRFNDKFLVKTDYTYLIAKNLVTGEIVANRPKKQWAVELRYRLIETLEMGMVSFFKGERSDFSGTMPSYNRQDVYVNYQFSNEDYFALKLGNIFDRDYQDIRDYGTFGRNFIFSWKRYF